MLILSGVLRFLFRKMQLLSCFLRVTKLKLFYPGATIDYKTKIAPGCSIVCVKGGKLHISNCTIHPGTHIFADKYGLISIKDSFIGRNCVITAKESVIIESGCLIAEMVVIRDQDHLVDLVSGIHLREKFLVAPVKVGGNVWIASKATILKGATIGEFSVIAAAAVVIRDVPAYEVWGGVPAKFIRAVKVE